jgi:transcriptional regulator with PAS, ATPase and Fis domain
MNAQDNFMDKWMRMHIDPDARQELDNLTRQSWETSLSYNLDYMNALPEEISPQEFNRIKRETKRLRVFANSVLEPLEQRYIDNGYGLILFDKSGCLLRLYGKERFQTWAANNHIKIATRWSEKNIGTNVFSLGIQQESLVSLIGENNFSRFLTNGAYFFAPIKLENGELYGGIALAIPRCSSSDNMLSWVFTITQVIELQLFWFGTVNTLGNMPDNYGILSIDRSNGQSHILIMSDEVIKIFGLPLRDYYYERLDNIIPNTSSNKSFWKIINTDLKVTDKNIRLDVNGKQIDINISAAPLKQKFHTHGVILHISSTKPISRLISQYSSNAQYSFDNIIKKSEAMQAVIQRSKTASLTDSNILLLGESGVGKDVIAQAIHNNSKRRNKPFIAINCASLSKDLIASELFGYESGAFTGAKKEGTLGKFELADNGTLFLDEIGDMPLDLQAILLRVLEEKSFRKVGGNTVVHVNVRIIAATNKNLMKKISDGLFREDLFYRLGIIRIHIPPLRNRESDIMILTRHFITQICAQLGKPAVRLSENATSFFKHYLWPGNVRELKNTLEGIISTNDELEISEQEIRRYLGDFTVETQFKEHAVAISQLFQNTQSQNEYIYDERKDFVQALKICHNNKTKAADYLGIPLRTFYRRLKKYGMLMV